MSTPPETQTTPPPGNPEHPHGLVEEIREEIEHAVEHVPKPVRWTVRKLILVAIAGLVTLVVLVVGTAVLYVVNRTEWVAKELTVFLNTTLAQRSDVSLEIADVRGNPFREVKLIRPRVRFREGDGPALLEAPVIHVRYSAWGFVSTRGRFVDILVEKPEIHLTRLPDGRMRLPTWKSAGPTPRKVRDFDVRLRLRDGKFLAPAPLGTTEALQLDALVSTGRATKVVVRDLSWKRGPYATTNLSLSGDVNAGDSVTFAVNKLKTPDLVLSAQGGWKKGETQKWIHADVSRVRWRWLSKAINSSTFDVDGEGAVVADARGYRTWDGRFTTRLVWDGLPARGASAFGWKDGRLTLPSLAVNTPGGNLRGSAAYSKLGWDVGGAVQGGDPSQWAALGIRDWPKGNLAGQFRYSVDSRRHTEHLTAALGGSELSGWRADRAQVEVRFPASGPDSFTVQMFRAGGEVDLVGQASEGGWHGSYVATRFPLEEWPDGRASGIHGILSRGEGNVTGGGGKLHITGTLAGESTDWLGAHMARWRLEGVDGLLLPKPDLGARARLEDVTFLGVHFDSALTPFRLGDGTLVFDSLRAGAGDTTFTMAGRADWTQGGWRMRLDRAEAASAQFHWTSVPPVLLAGDKTGVDFERLEARDGPATLAMSGR